jgi:biotin carboxyl carrier protein
VHTGFIVEHKDTLTLTSTLSQREKGQESSAGRAGVTGSSSPWDVTDGWRFNLPPAKIIHHARTDASGNESAAAAHSGAILSPMPGQILQINVKVGDPVKRGQPLLIVEAMKMEHTLTAPMDGVVESIAYPAASRVEEGALLMTLK